MLFGYRVPNGVHESMAEEKVRREVAVHKWKHLYLTIKAELDDLIQRTQGGKSLTF